MKMFIFNKYSCSVIILAIKKFGVDNFQFIIDEIKKWISREILNPSEYATFDMQCLILVCYFIQDCEVFGHEVS